MGRHHSRRRHHRRLINAMAALSEAARAAARTTGLEVTQEEHVLRLEIRRPDAGNSLDRDLLATLESTLRAVNDDASVHVVVLTAAGERIFCGGADLKSERSFKLQDTGPRAPFARVLRALRDVEVPVVARVNGSAAGAGFALLGLCDFVIAAEHARFSLPEVNIGLFPTQVVVALQRAIPRPRLVRLCMTGEPITAAEAHAIGMVGEVVPLASLDRCVEATVAKLVGKSPSALRRGKYLLRAIDAMGFEESLCLAETMLKSQAADPNVAEGLAAFREKRSPRWI